MTLDAVGSVVCFILSLFACLKPDEFDRKKDEITANLIKKARISVGFRNSMPEDRGLAGTVAISIKNYKIKVENNKQIVFYNITVKIKGEVYKVRRTYNQFDKLYISIRKHFPLETFPYMVFPPFPVFNNMNFDMDTKTTLLNEFLQALCCPEFMIEETLDFLNIQGDFRDNLAEEHEEVLEAEKTLMVSEIETESFSHRSVCSDQKQSIFEKSNKMHTNLHMYFSVKIFITELESRRTDYTVV